VGGCCVSRSWVGILEVPIGPLVDLIGGGLLSPALCKSEHECRWTCMASCIGREKGMVERTRRNNIINRKFSGNRNQE